MASAWRATARGSRAASIADVLDMTVAEALAFFARTPEVVQALEPLAAVLYPKVKARALDEAGGGTAGGLTTVFDQSTGQGQLKERLPFRATVTRNHGVQPIAESLAQLVRHEEGIGLAGELGAGITLVSELMSRESRGWGTTIVASLGLLGHGPGPGFVHGDIGVELPVPLFNAGEHGLGHLQHQTNAILERTAVLVTSLVAQR